MTESEKRKTAYLSLPERGQLGDWSDDILVVALDQNATAKVVDSRLSGAIYDGIREAESFIGNLTRVRYSRYSSGIDSHQTKLLLNILQFFLIRLNDTVLLRNEAKQCRELNIAELLDFTD